MTSIPDGILRLSLRQKEAAEALGISVRYLRTLTKRGEIPHVRMGTAVVYPVKALERWLAGKMVARGERDEVS